MRASVVIPCFNYGHHLTEAVESVLAQTLEDVEVVIVDDGSTDDSVAVAEALIAAHPDAAIELIAQGNCGKPGAVRNTGIAASSGEYVLCLDADDKLDPHFLERCVAALDADAQAGIAYGDQQHFGGREQFVPAPEWDSRRELDANFLGTASVFRREAWEQTGGYDVEIGYEDWDFWIGVIEAGWAGVKVPGALWHYRVHDGGVYSSHTKDDQGIKAQIILRRSGAYCESQRRWARAVLDGQPFEATAQGVMPPYVEPKPATLRPDGRALPINSICLITKDYPPSVPGGIPRAVQMQAHNLAAVGVEVHVITKSASGASIVRDDRGVMVHEIPEPGLGVPRELEYLEIPLWAFTAASKFAELDASVRFDVVETPDYRGEALHLQPRKETALAIWLHSTMRVVWNCTPGYVCSAGDDAWHSLEMAALERADQLIAPSQLLLDTTSEFLGERMRPVELVPYLFDSTQFPVLRAERDGGPLGVLFYGRLEARKNPEAAIYAVAAARRRGLDVQLTFLGRDNEQYRQRVLAPLEGALGVTDTRYIPHADIDGLRAALAETDVAILASRFDNSPLTIFEALSSGVPVITSDKVGTASWIDPDDGLLTLPIDDMDAFGERAADALADASWLASGSRAAERMREKFAPEVVTERLLDLYARLMEGRREPVRIEGARSSAVLAFADEVTAEPELLRAFAESFGSDDDVTLVIYAPGWTEDEAATRLGEAVAQTGLDGDGVPDVLAMPVPHSSQTDAMLSAGACAVLSRRELAVPFDSLPRVSSVAELSEVA